MHLPKHAALLLVVFALLPVLAADPSAKEDAVTPPDPAKLVVAATVNNDPVYVSEINREVAKVVRNRETTPHALKLLQAKALDQLISRRLILQHFDGKKTAASTEDIALAVAKAKDRLKQQNLTLEQFLQRSGLTRIEFDRTIVWQLTWQHYLDRFVTDENLKRHFEQHRKQFDGTQLQVSQILLKVDADAGTAAWDSATKKAESIRDQIRGGKFDFAAAAKKFSRAPSADAGGDIGLITRYEPMTESFSKAAFDLKNGEVSPPVRTRFGVHLIQCTKVVPGQKSLDDVRRAVETALTRFLFDWVADRQRPGAQIHFTRATPHFDPQSGNLVDSRDDE